MFDGSRILVAGGAGFVGTNLIARLVGAGLPVRATLHRRKPVIRYEPVEYVQADLTEMADCRRAVDGVDLVFMCAASSSGAAVIASTPLVHVTPNIVMNARMLEAAHAAGVRKFVWLSSNAAYPPTGDRAVREDEMFDGDPYDTYFGVGWMKRYTELLCRLYSEKLNRRMATVVIRPSNIYGPYDDFDFATSHVMAATIRKVAERHDPIVMWGTGEDIRDLIYIDDFIDALVLAAERIDTYDPINVGQGEAHSLKAILQTILEVDGYTGATVTYDPSKPSMIPVRRIDVGKAERVLGFRPRTTLPEGIAKTLAWYRHHAAEPVGSGRTQS